MNFRVKPTGDREPDELLSKKQIARQLGIDTTNLDRWRRLKRFPPGILLSENCLRWRRSVSNRAKRDSHIDPPASSYAIMRTANPYRGENSGPGKDNHGELDPRPGIREHPGSKADIVAPVICFSFGLSDGWPQEPPVEHPSDAPRVLVGQSGKSAKRTQYTSSPVVAPTPLRSG
jgi:predicted DNA-binding transcriptional regulator AlpA